MLPIENGTAGGKKEEEEKETGAAGLPLFPGWNIIIMPKGRCLRA